MSAKREDVEKIIATVPGFHETWQDFLKQWEKEDSPPYYLGMGELSHYIVEKYAQQATAEFPQLFASVEALLHKPDPELENLITVGLLEDIQNVASHRDFGAAPFLQWLGPRSLVVWNEINAYMKRVSDWAAKQEPRRSAFDAEKALSQVENPQLRKIIESMYRKSAPVTGHPLAIDTTAESASPTEPAFVARPAGAPVYHGFQVLNDVAVDGFVFGKITDFELEPCESGDAFVIAPDNSRAGLVWEVSDKCSFQEVCPADANRWGVWSVSFPWPMTSRDNVRKNLESILPELRARWDEWREKYAK